MGFAINSTVICGGCIAAGFAISDDAGMQAAGLFGTLYLCGMSFYGVAGMMGLAVRPLLNEDEEHDQKQPGMAKSKQPSIGSALQRTAMSADREMRKLEDIARPK